MSKIIDLEARLMAAKLAGRQRARTELGLEPGSAKMFLVEDIESIHPTLEWHGLWFTPTAEFTIGRELGQGSCWIKSVWLNRDVYGGDIITNLEENLQNEFTLKYWKTTSSGLKVAHKGTVKREVLLAWAEKRKEQQDARWEKTCAGL